jgi:hypothetical protein
MSNYSQFFLNSSSHVVQLELLEISHPDFSQVYRIVRNAINGVTVTLEDASSHTFDYYPVKITPTGSSNDLDQKIELQFGDLGEILPMELDRVLERPSTKPTLLYRTYRSDDLTAPLFGPQKFQINMITFKKEGALMEATAARLNLNTTGEVYTMDRFPILNGFL